MALISTGATILAAGAAGLGLGVGIVLGVAILRYVRDPNGGGRVNHRAGPHAIDDDDTPA